MDAKRCMVYGTLLAYDIPAILFCMFLIYRACVANLDQTDLDHRASCIWQWN